MSKKLDKKHWYDGWIYSKIIDTKSIPFRYKIFDFINKSSTVLDVGCGTGGFTMEISKHCKRVVGIDVSKKQIDYANKRVNSENKSNIEFKHVHAAHIADELKCEFDYAVFTFMIHEISQLERLSVLTEISKCAKKVVILEYNVPHPYNFWGIATRLIEFFAGWNHFSNFLDFIKQGGIKQILDTAGFEVINTRTNRQNIFMIVSANKDTN